MLTRPAVLLVATLLLAAACATEPRPAIILLTTTVPDGPVLRTSFDTVPRWPVGVPDTVYVTARNTTDRTLTLHFGTTCQIMPYVRNPAGQLVVPGEGGYVCAEMATVLQFQPAETKSFAFPWSTDSLPGGAYVAFAAFTAVETSGESNHATQQLVTISLCTTTPCN